MICLSRKVSFRVTLNDSVEAVAQVTILLNDFGTYQGTIEAGSGTDTVLLFEMPESTPEDLSKISLEVVETRYIRPVIYKMVKISREL